MVPRNVETATHRESGLNAMSYYGYHMILVSWEIIVSNYQSISVVYVNLTILPALSQVYLLYTKNTDDVQPSRRIRRGVELYGIN